MEPAHVTVAFARPGVRWALGLILTGGGLVLPAVGLGVVSSDSTSGNESRVVVTSVGVLLAACGVLLGQWVAVGSRLYHALGGTAVTSMAIIFGWVAIYGQASGFSGGVSIGGAALTSSGSATPARIAFGIVSVVFGVASLPAWKQVFRQRG